MSRSFRNSSAEYTAAGARVDEGLRSYMLQVYNLMAAGLGVTGLVAWFVSTSPELLQAIFGSPLRWVVLFAPLGLAFFLSARISTLSVPAARGFFWAYAVSVGVSFSSLFLVFQGESIARVFFISASVFGGMSLYGYTTRRDLTGMGHFLIMGVWGLLVAGLVNLFLKSSALHFAGSLLGVLIFTGLTAYDTQAIKEMYMEMDEQDTASRKALFGALMLYMDFINIFVHLLQFLGVRRSD
jgi:FtsH-binding integral membrane protein